MSDSVIGKLPLFLEVVGPAGAGKTTVAVALCERGSCFVRAPKPSLRKASDLPFFLISALPLLPIVLRQNPASLSLTRREFWWMIYLSGWHDVMGNSGSSDANVMVLDHGPLYMLTTLLGFFPEMTACHELNEWWKRTYELWISLLDYVVWLDAPNSVLADRINGRETSHVVKGKSRDKMYDFLNRYRSAFESVIPRSQTGLRGPIVLSFFTHRVSAEQIVVEIGRVGIPHAESVRGED